MSPPFTRNLSSDNFSAIAPKSSPFFIFSSASFASLHHCMRMILTRTLSGIRILRCSGHNNLLTPYRSSARVRSTVLFITSCKTADRTTFFFQIILEIPACSSAVLYSLLVPNPSLIFFICSFTSFLSGLMPAPHRPDTEAFVDQIIECFFEKLFSRFFRNPAMVRGFFNKLFNLRFQRCGCKDSTVHFATISLQQMRRAGGSEALQ